MRTITEVVDENPLGLTRAELRLRISSAVPLSGAYSCFGKADLNAIYHHLTGEHIFPKKDLGTPDSPTMAFVRSKVASEVGFKYEQSSRGRSFRQEELAQLCEAVEEQTDRQRRMEEMEA